MVAAEVMGWAWSSSWVGALMWINYKNTWFLTFLGATWAGFERHFILELDQCSNSITHQNLAPTKTHMEVHVLSMESKHKEWRTRIKNWTEFWKASYWTEKKTKNKVGKVNVNGRKWRKHIRKWNYRKENWRKERRHLYEDACWILRIGRSHSRHLEPWTKISDGVPPLEAHYSSQDKAKKKKTQNSQILTKFGYSLSTIKFQSELWRT